MKYNYVTIYNKNTAFLQAHPLLKRVVQIGNLVLTALFPIAYALLLVNSLFIKEFEPKETAFILFFPLLALLTVSVLRLLVERPRPYEENGANIAPLFQKKSVGNSFPSRHLTCTAVIAWTVASQFFGVGILLFVCALLLSYTRFAAGWHYPSDIFAGLGIGTVIGIFTLFI